MSSSKPIETRRDRAGLVRDAGLGRLSLVSVLAGVLVAYGAFAVLAALVGAIAAAIGLNTTLSANDWSKLGMGSAIAVAVVLLLAYLFGGYVAGRMARRAGLLHGLAVFVVAVILVAVVGALVASQADAGAIQTNLRSLGIPTSGTEWGKVGTVAGVASLVAMLVGAVLGGMLGERWHTKLSRRATSPDYGPAPTDPAPPEPDRQTGPVDQADERDQTGGDGRTGTGATRADPDQPRQPNQ